MPFHIAATTAANAASNGATRSQTPRRTGKMRRSGAAATRPTSSAPAQSDNPTQLLIKQAVDYLIQQLEAGKSETLTAYLNAMARFHSYSFGNILQIARQRPTATRVAGIRTWNEMGRFVKKGEKGIQILAPMIGIPAQERCRRRIGAGTGNQASARPDRLPRRVRVRCGADRRRGPAGV